MAPFKQIEMDQMGPFVQSDAGNRYFNVIVDRYRQTDIFFIDKKEVITDLFVIEHIYK